MVREVLRRFDRDNDHLDTLDAGALATLAHSLLDRRDALIVLDNVEPGLPVGRVVAPLRATGVTLFLTARETLPSSAVPADASRALSVLEEADAVALFAAYYGQGPYSTLLAETQPLIQTIVEELGRHTLAVKLAAAYAVEPGHALVTLVSIYG